MSVRLSVYFCLLTASCLANCECNQDAIAKQTQSLKPADVAGITKDAETGDVAAQYLPYESGDGVPQDYAFAPEWYQRAHERCNTTLPPNPPFTPPSLHPQSLPNGSFWYGTEKLWTGLQVAGNWGGLQNEKGYRNKVFWFRRGYSVRTEPKPALTVTGRRLDGEEAEFTVSDATNAYLGTGRAAMLTAFEIPTPGCWELTGDYRGDTLRFVVWVEP